ncbi:MAG: hypothetical protein II497_03290 [Lachnospiraceae bacterium]|nr:hypothetical protein [Lachnospiraceae bacterium]
MNNDDFSLRQRIRIGSLAAICIFCLCIRATPAYASGLGDMVNLVLSSIVTAALYLVIAVLDRAGDLLLSVMSRDIGVLEEMGLVKGFEAFADAVKLLAVGLAVLLFVCGIYSLITAPLRGKEQAETVAVTVARGFFIPFAVFSKDIFLWAFSLVQNIYRGFLADYSAMADSRFKVDFLTKTFSVDNLGSLPEGTFVSTGPVTDTVRIIVTYLLVILVLWNFLMLILEITQRFVILLVYIYLSPMRAACGANAATSDILKRSIKSFAVGSVLYLFNIWTVGIALSLLGYASNGGLVSFGRSGNVLWALIAYGFIKAAQQLDDIFNRVSADNTTLSGNPLSEILAMRGLWRVAGSAAGRVGTFLSSGSSSGGGGNADEI